MLYHKYYVPLMKGVRKDALMDWKEDTYCVFRRKGQVMKLMVDKVNDKMMVYENDTLIDEFDGIPVTMLTVVLASKFDIHKIRLNLILERPSTQEEIEEGYGSNRTESYMLWDSYAAPHLTENMKFFDITGDMLDDVWKNYKVVYTLKSKIDGSNLTATLRRGL